MYSFHPSIRTLNVEYEHTCYQGLDMRRYEASSENNKRPYI